MSDLHMFKRLTALLAVVTALVPQLRAQGNFNSVYNGDFEQGLYSWTVSNIGPNGGLQASGGNPGAYFILSGSSSSGGSPTIMQGVKAGPPFTYLIQGDYASLGTSSINPSFAVSVDGVVFFQTALPADTAWHHFSFYYTPTTLVNGGIVLSLSAPINGESVGVAIDNIGVFAAPEPGTLSLLALSVCAIVFKKRN